jgi:Rrf2 family nitric oxide-sensitive transcriptional repressor
MRLLRSTDLALRVLMHLGLLDARRGRGRGLTLTERGRTASVGAVVRSFEGDGDVVDCENSAAPAH